MITTMVITWKFRHCHIVKANIIIRCYLFPHWLFTDSGDDDHFAHCTDERYCFYCVTYLAVFGSWDTGLLLQCHVQLNK